MKMTPRWPGWARALLVALAGVDAFALVLLAKRAWLPAYLRWELPLAAAALLGLALVLESARRLLHASSLATWSFGVPLVALLAVDLVVTPLPYELAPHAADLPRPEGEVAPPLVETARRFERAHPVASVEFRYGAARDLPAFANETVAAFERGGWSVSSFQPPEGDRPGDFGVVQAARDPLRATCVVGRRGGYEDWSGPLLVLGCHVTV